MNIKHNPATILLLTDENIHSYFNSLYLLTPLSIAFPHACLYIVTNVKKELRGDNRSMSLKSTYNDVIINIKTNTLINNQNKQTLLLINNTKDLSKTSLDLIIDTRITPTNTTYRYIKKSHILKTKHAQNTPIYTFKPLYKKYYSCLKKIGIYYTETQELRFQNNPLTQKISPPLVLNNTNTKALVSLINKHSHIISHNLDILLLTQLLNKIPIYQTPIPKNSYPTMTEENNIFIVNSKEKTHKIKEVNKKTCIKQHMPLYIKGFKNSTSTQLIQNHWQLSPQINKASIIILHKNIFNTLRYAFYHITMKKRHFIWALSIFEIELKLNQLINID